MGQDGDPDRVGVADGPHLPDVASALAVRHQTLHVVQFAAALSAAEEQFFLPWTEIFRKEMGGKQ